MNRFLRLTLWAAFAALPLLNACSDRHQTMAMKSQQAFEEARSKGIPIAKGGHGGHTNAGGDEAIRGMPGMGMAATASSAGDMKVMQMPGTKPGGMKGMDTSGTKPAGMKGMSMPGMKHGDMKGMDMSGMKRGDMKSMDMPGMKHGDMKGMDMSGMKSGDMKAMDMPGMKPGQMKGMDMPGMAMTPVVPQPKALQANAGETAATLLSDPLDRPAASSVSSAQQSAEMNQAMASGGGMTMAMGSYVQRDVGRPSSAHAGTGSVPQKSAMYVCASHPEIVRDRPGKCPVDGTPLVKKEMH